jgi:hypothetical protein
LSGGACYDERTAENGEQDRKERQKRYAERIVYGVYGDDQ